MLKAVELNEILGDSMNPFEWLLLALLAMPVAPRNHDEQALSPACSTQNAL
jgi:hypothetical protein